MKTIIILGKRYFSSTFLPNRHQQTQFLQRGFYEYRRQSKRAHTPSRFNSRISFSPSFVSHTIHCFAGRARESVHVLHVTWAHGFMTGNKRVNGYRTRTNPGYALCIITLLLSSFLQDGHIGSCWSSFFSADDPSTGVDATDREGAEEVWKEKWTGIRCFRLKRISITILRCWWRLHSHNWMRGISASTCGLQFHVLQRSRRTTWSVCRCEWWKPKVW